MNGEEFDIGDVVYLKSGSPPMTVEETTNTLITAVWFRKDSRGVALNDAIWNESVHRATFNPKCLTKTQKE